MLGFNALGRFAIGQDSLSIALTATAGAFTEVGIAATFKISETVQVGAFSETGVSSAFKTTFLAGSSSYVLTGSAALLMPAMIAQPGSYVITGNVAELTRDYVNWFRDSAPSSVWTQENRVMRVFDPRVFDLDPTFDTGSSAGIWTNSQNPSGVWNVR